MNKNTARLVVLAVILMICLNGVLLVLLWTKSGPSMDTQRPPVEEVDAFIIKEMGFDDAAASQFRKMAARHRENQMHLQRRFREIKRELNHAMLGQREEDARLLMDELAEVVKLKEAELYRFFGEVMSITNEEQQREFGRIFREATGPPPYERNPSDGDARMPPPPPRP